MSIEKHRCIFFDSNKKLKRARRLYGQLSSRAINENPEVAHVLARRVRDYGLYSEKTDLRCIVFYLCRAAYARSKYFDRLGGFGWYDWIKNSGGPIWQKTKKIPSVNGKLKIRLAANEMV